MLAWQDAARAIRHAMGGPYYSLHVRRSDKLKECDPRECRTRDTLTQPPAIERALRLWFPPNSRLYIGSTERPAFFAPLNTSYRLFFAETFPHLLANVSNNYMLYAVETLVFFGSSGSVETLGYTAKWLEDACFPAARLRVRGGWQAGRPRAEGLGDVNCSSAGAAGWGGGTESVGGSGVHVTCVDESGLVANGVTYGAACIHNPPCGKRMTLSPAPEPCLRRTDRRPKQRRRS